eukprot:scaffold241318_cov19-Tisochrysis_lutea.AAC.2
MKDWVGHNMIISVCLDLCWTLCGLNWHWPVWLILSFRNPGDAWPILGVMLIYSCADLLLSSGGPGAIKPNKLLQDPLVAKLAQETNKSPAQ